MEFPDFDDTLRQAFRRETELLFETIMRDDRSVMEFLTADYTFVNERLARHYGIPGVRGSQFRRIAVTDDSASRAARTRQHSDGHLPAEPDLAGQAREMGSRKSHGRAAAAAAAERAGARRKAGPDHPQTMKARMEEHRANPACANCHRLMDPIGLAMENFDAVGAWRTRDNRVPIDASTRLADGTRAQRRRRAEGGAAEAAGDFPADPDREPADLRARPGGRRPPTCRRSARFCEARRASDFHFSSLVLGIVNSPAFQMRVKPLQDDAS